MVKLDICLFDTIQWQWIDFEIIAESKEKALEAVEREYPRQYRDSPHSNGEDSLRIEFEFESEYFIVNQ